MTSEREPAQLGYEAYSAAAGGRSLVSGDPLPGWGDLPEQIRGAWRAAVDAVREEPEDSITFAGGG